MKPLRPIPSHFGHILFQFQLVCGGMKTFEEIVCFVSDQSLLMKHWYYHLLVRYYLHHNIHKTWGINPFEKQCSMAWFDQIQQSSRKSTELSTFCLQVRQPNQGQTLMSKVMFQLSCATQFSNMQQHFIHSFLLHDFSFSVQRKLENRGSQKSNGKFWFKKQNSANLDYRNQMLKGVQY